DRLVEDALKIHGSRDGFNGSPPPKLRVSDEQIIDFAAAHRVGDEQDQMGKGRDLLGVDEATHFAESQIRFLMGWNRTDTPGQRVRTVLATNPPLTAEGLWVIKMFAPWLDPAFPKPAKPGELRWVISDEDGKDLWVDGPHDIRTVNGKELRPTSRTYIPSKVTDNPYYAQTDYERQLDAMPEPYRSLLMGGFRTSFRDAENQVIPTVWIRDAMTRWTPRPPDGIPMCAIGVDASGGGEDPMVLATRFDGWFAPITEVPGKSIPMDRSGTFAAGIVISHRRDRAGVVVDLGGGYGNSMYEHLKLNDIDVIGHKGAEASTLRTRDKQLKFYNKRSEVIWRFREALDPDQPGGSPIVLPDDPILLA
ncbi:MAG TPA: terminase, partial [Nitrospiria bacterium]|nr:terminase [Nitrospiria bacterium]